MKRRSLNAATRFRILERDGFACRYCGGRAPGVKLHVDHVIPVSRGGSDDMDNLVTSCNACNLGKGARELDDAVTVTIADDELVDFLDTISNEIDTDMPTAVEALIRYVGGEIYDMYIAEAKELSKSGQNNGVH